MSLDPIVNLPLIYQIHIVAALVALFLGPLAILRRRRDRLHKVSGYVWVVAMTVTAVSSFGMPSHFSPIGVGPIHLLSLFALSGLYQGMRAIFARDIQQHELAMRNVYTRGILLAGAFNFLPNRSFQRALLPDAEAVGYVIIGVVVFIAFRDPIRRIIKRLGNTGKMGLEVARGLR